MAFLSSKLVQFWLLVVTCHVIVSIDATTAKLWHRMMMLAKDDEQQGTLFPPYGLINNTVDFKKKRAPHIAGFEPGDKAAPFKVVTLDGEFIYKPSTGLLGQGPGPLIIHVFTHKSGFLECLWNSESSLSDLVQSLPQSAQVLFVSLDDSAVSDALWMRDQVIRAAMHSPQEVMSRLHFSPVPVFLLGNWIPNVIYSWSCTGHNCGLSQAVFTSEGWNMPVIVKRLDARYDWLIGRWGQRSYKLIDAGDGCNTSDSVTGAVAWVSDGNCSFFTKVQNMAQSNASGVLVYALPGNSIQDMNCVGNECSVPLGIPAAMMHLEVSVAQALRFQQPVNVSFQNTPSPNFFFAIDQQGQLAEMGWFLYPTFKFIGWQAQWFDFYEGLRIKLGAPAQVVSVFDKTLMQGEKGAVATVDLPFDMLNFDTLELDASLSCPSGRDSTCPHWDHVVQLFVCCDHFSAYCNVELGRWITAFRRGIGRWLTDVSPLLPLLNNNKCTFTMRTVAWAMPWMASLNLRFSSTNQTGNSVEKLYPFRVMSMYSGGTFDKNYNKGYQPIKFRIPPSTKKVELYAVITGHGSDENGCGEFCVTSHHFVINGVFNNTRIFDSAGSALGCTLRVKEGAVPNEHGTWLYGRGGWCDGLQVDPWRIDITRQLDMTGYESNTLIYFGLYSGQDPNPVQNPGYITMSSFLVFYK